MATIALRLSVTSTDLERVAGQLKNIKETRVAISRAINRTLTTARGAIADRVMEITGIKQRSKILKRFSKSDQTFAKPDRLSGYIEIKGRPVGAINLPHLITKKYGVVWKHTLYSPAEHFYHGFVGKGLVGKGDTNKGNKQLWSRVKDKRKYFVLVAHHKPNQEKRRQRIRPIYGPRIDTLYTRFPSIRRETEEIARATLTKRIDSQIKYFLDKRQPKPSEAEPAVKE